MPPGTGGIAAKPFPLVEWERDRYAILQFDTNWFTIQAADREAPLDALSVEVTGHVDYRAGREGFEEIPVYPHNLAYTVPIDSPASDDELAE